MQVGVSLCFVQNLMKVGALSPTPSNWIFENSSQDFHLARCKSEEDAARGGMSV